MSRPRFYEKVDLELSQGDIVASLPYGLIDDPLCVCRQSPLWVGPAADAERPPAFVREDSVENVLARSKSALSIVLWHGCEIDKFLNKGAMSPKAFAAIAPVLPLDRIGNELAQDQLRQGKRRAYFYLEPFDHDGQGEREYYVDLRYLWSVKQSLLLSSRVGRLSGPAVMALYAHMFFFFTGANLSSSSLKCRNCGEHNKLSEVSYPWNEQDLKDPAG